MRMTKTALTLEILNKGKALPPFAIHECSQSLTPLSQGTLRRTINGYLVHVGHKGYEKFHSTLTCKGHLPPFVKGLWKGTLLKVGCIQPLTQEVPTQSREIQLDREVVSCRLHDHSLQGWPLRQREDRWVSFSSEFPGGFITYFPSLTMMVKNFQLEIDEEDLVVRWKLELEEV